MKKAFFTTVSAITYTIAFSNYGRDAHEISYNQMACFVLSQHKKMPDYLRLPIKILTIVFNCFGWFSGGAAFSTQSYNKRLRQIERWRSSRLSFKRDFIKFYESLVTLSLYSNITLPKGRVS